MLHLHTPSRHTQERFREMDGSGSTRDQLLQESAWRAGSDSISAIVREGEGKDSEGNWNTREDKQLEWAGGAVTTEQPKRDLCAGEGK